jgi:hypothetical protein
MFFLHTLVATVVPCAPARLTRRNPPRQRETAGFLAHNYYYHFERALAEFLAVNLQDPSSSAFRILLESFKPAVLHSN